MNALQLFIQSHLYLTEKTLPGLITLDRLCPVLVRCGGCRFTCAAQDVEHLLQCIYAGKDYVRDVSFPVGSIEAAEDWKPDDWTFRYGIHKTPRGLAPHEPLNKSAHDQERKRANDLYGFNEAQCGGVYDGLGTVHSDADPGL